MSARLYDRGTGAVRMIGNSLGSPRYAGKDRKRTWIVFDNGLVWLRLLDAQGFTYWKFVGHIARRWSVAVARAFDVIHYDYPLRQSAREVARSVPVPREFRNHVIYRDLVKDRDKRILAARCL